MRSQFVFLFVIVTRYFNQINIKLNLMINVEANNKILKIIRHPTSGFYSLPLQVIKCNSFTFTYFCKVI